MGLFTLPCFTLPFVSYSCYVPSLQRLFEEWKELEVTHSLTVVFFSRTYMSRDSNSESVDLMARQASAGRRDADGRLYEVSGAVLGGRILQFVAF